MNERACLVAEGEHERMIAEGESITEGEGIAAHEHGHELMV